MIHFLSTFIVFLACCASTNAVLPHGSCLGDPTAVSRAPNTVDAFVIGSDGHVYTASLLPGGTSYGGYWNIPGFTASPCYPIAAVSRTPNRLDIFAIGTNSQIYQASWEPDFSGWQGWNAVPGFRVHGGAKYVTAISRSNNLIDLFAVGTDNNVWTSGWAPESGWGTWRSIPGITVGATLSISASSREANFLDIFAVDTNGYIWTAAWQPGDSTWAGWWSVAGGRTSPSASVSSVSRSADHLDVFVVGTDNNIYTAAWQPGFNGFQGWWLVAGAHTFQPTAPITSISRTANEISIFVTGTDHNIWTSYWSPSSNGWAAWIPIESYYGPGGAKLGAVSIASDRVDLLGYESNAPLNPSTLTWQVDSWMSKNEQSSWCFQGNILGKPFSGCPYF